MLANAVFRGRGKPGKPYPHATICQESAAMCAVEYIDSVLLFGSRWRLLLLLLLRISVGPLLDNLILHRR